MKKTEHNSVGIMWENYLETIGESISNTKKEYVSWHFEITEGAANKLAKLVLEGKKKATASSLWVYEYEGELIPNEGDYSIITDWDGVAVCIIQTKRVEIIPFNLITGEHARKEGEGDLSLEYWKKVHEEFFTEECDSIDKEFTEDMPVIFEEFEVVYI
ncbi:ASCH domain-containing protein [Tissierella carlieri]|uniref:ASCH domain-containing protein n=1 Tax=Tissierella carlieri TaxID=689904 RepID=A0ABT1SFG6_9FIRM|nr:ASCH domain-containing protein [Tissierella carlieri]MCQ4925102.1 ASCH domain-containing protein [Tissierella carlieri]